jgi:hypothetical protein
VTEDILIPGMFVAALLIFWTAVVLVWLLGRRRPTGKEPSDR